MISTVHVSEIFELIVVLAGVILSFKRVADMDGYHKVRIVALTLILSAVPVLFFLGYAVQLGRPGFYDCVVEFDDRPDHW